MSRTSLPLVFAVLLHASAAHAQIPVAGGTDVVTGGSTLLGVCLPQAEAIERMHHAWYLVSDYQTTIGQYHAMKADYDMIHSVHPDANDGEDYYDVAVQAAREAEQHFNRAYEYFGILQTYTLVGDFCAGFPLFGQLSSRDEEIARMIAHLEAALADAEEARTNMDLALTRLRKQVGDIEAALALIQALLNQAEMELAEQQMLDQERDAMLPPPETITTLPPTMPMEPADDCAAPAYCNSYNEADISDVHSWSCPTSAGCGSEPYTCGGSASPC